MIPSALITFREVIEASLIVATILGILYKLNFRHSVKTVWAATGAAFASSIAFLVVGSLLGFKVRELYSGKVEEITEGILMIVSAIFITWAVFFLHTYFSKYKVKLLQKVKETVDQNKQRGLFILVFTAVFREGIEIVLFLSSMYFSSNPQEIYVGFIVGALGGLSIAVLVMRTTLKLPIYYAFRATSVLLILFAAGLLAQGVHEFAEVGLVPEFTKVSLAFVPQAGTLMGDTIKAMFGVTRHMDYSQLALYGTYVATMGWYVFLREKMAKKPLLS